MWHRLWENRRVRHGHPIVRQHELDALEDQAWKLKNDALKFIRDTNEDPRGTPNVEFVDLFEEEPPHEIKTLVRGTGMDYEFQEPLQPWSWRKMLKAMKPELRDQIFGRFGEDLPVGALDSN